MPKQKVKDKDTTWICDATMGHLIDATREKFQILFKEDLGRRALLKNIFDLIKKRDMESLAKISPMIKESIQDDWFVA